MPQLPKIDNLSSAPTGAAGSSALTRESWLAIVGLLLERLAAARGREAGAASRQPLRCLLIGLSEGLELDALLAHALTGASAHPAMELIILPVNRLAAGALPALAAGLGRADDPGWRALIRSWPAGLPGLHRIVLPAAAGRGRGLRVLVGIGEPARLLRQLAWPVDGLVLIAGQVAPPLGGAARMHPPMDHDRSPATRSAVLAALKARSQPGSLLLCAAASPADRDAITSGGFEPQAPPIIAGWPDGAMLARRRGSSPGTGGRAGLGDSASVAVVGAGLAGSACAAVLAREGWRVLLFDASTRPTAGNGQPRLADHPHLSPDDNLLARLSRHGLAAAQRWREPAARGGRLQLASDTLAAEQQRRACQALGEHADAFARLVDAEEAAQLAGLALGRGGLWLPHCEAHDPAMLAARWRATSGVESRFGVTVDRWARHEDRWHLHGRDGAVIARVDALVIATAGAMPAQAASLLPPLQRLRGQSTRVRTPLLRELRCVVADRGYACPLADDTALVGASTDPGDDMAPDPADEQANLARLAVLIPALAGSAAAPRALGNAVGLRFSPPDRLPLAGELLDERVLRAGWHDWARDDRRPLPRLDGVHVLAGLGARGSLWAPLGAECIADALAGRMPALERDLLEAIDPARFARQRLRRGLMP